MEVTKISRAINGNQNTVMLRGIDLIIKLNLSVTESRNVAKFQVRSCEGCLWWKIVTFLTDRCVVRTPDSGKN